MFDIVIQRCDLVSKDYCIHVFFSLKILYKKRRKKKEDEI